MPKAKVKPKKAPRRRPVAISPLPAGQYREAEADELPDLTAEGWRVVCPVPYLEEKVDPSAMANLLDCNGVAMINLTGTAAVSLMPMIWRGATKHSLTTRYLLWRDAKAAEKSRLVELKKEVKTADAARIVALEAKRALEQRNEELTSASVTATRELGEAQVARDRAAKSLTEMTQKHDALKTENTQLRAQMGKLWRAFGEVRMREVFGSEAKNPDPITPQEEKTAYDRLNQG